MFHRTAILKSSENSQSQHPPLGLFHSKWVSCLPGKIATYLEQLYFRTLAIGSAVVMENISKCQTTGTGRQMCNSYQFELECQEKLEHHGNVCCRKNSQENSTILNYQFTNISSLQHRQFHEIFAEFCRKATFQQKFDNFCENFQEFFVRTL